jgi:acetyltransferase-like isoleucine patch superfamily enzyme
MDPARTLSWDWYQGTVPDNVTIEEDAYLETTFSFLQYRSKAACGIHLKKGSSVYLATMFDVGSQGRVVVGEYTLVNGARIICDNLVEIGDYGLISWNVVFMDTYRLPMDPAARRAELDKVTGRSIRPLPSTAEARPVKIGRNVWIGFDCCILPGVTIGDGAIVGARSVVTEDIPPYGIAVGNPARVIRILDKS